MVLRPRLVKAVMDMPTVWKVSPGVITNFRIDVELWKSVGLCIHPAKPLAERNAHEKWAVSHYQSGRFIAQNVSTRSEAIQMMMNLWRNVLSDWRMTYEQIEARRDFDVIKQKIISTRKDGHDVKNVQTGKRKTNYKFASRI